MRVAVLDLGTNTFHLMVGEKRYGKIYVVHTSSIFVKIGSGSINEGRLTQAAMQRAEDALRQFYSEIEKQDVFKVVGMATSAIRSAQNGTAFLHKMRESLDFNIRAISGEEEAELIYEGVKTCIDLGKETSLLMDIGGGSVEFIIGDEKKAHWMKSFEVGAQRMYDLFHKSEPIEQEGIEALKFYLHEELEDLLQTLQRHEITTLVGSSGTFKTLANIDKRRKGYRPPNADKVYTLAKKDFYEIFPLLVENTKEDRIKIPGLKTQRADMIVVGFLLIDFILDKIPAVDTIQVSMGSLREGLLKKVLTVGN